MFPLAVNGDTTLTSKEYQALLAAHPARRKTSKRQQESVDQKIYVKLLNSLKIGFFYRVKNMGTFDPVRKIYRKNAELVSIPDITGYLFGGLAVYIEVKRVQRLEARKKLIFKVQITDGQKQFLLDAYRAGCRSGVAFNQLDCIAIATADPKRYPRHPRTYCFLPDDELKAYAEEYAATVHKNAALKQDPLYRDITLALPDKD